MIIGRPPPPAGLPGRVSSSRPVAASTIRSAPPGVTLIFQTRTPFSTLVVTECRAAGSPFGSGRNFRGEGAAGDGSVAWGSGAVSRYAQIAATAPAARATMAVGASHHGIEAGRGEEGGTPDMGSPP